jgi:hypothetical protein
VIGSRARSIQVPVEAIPFSHGDLDMVTEVSNVQIRPGNLREPSLNRLFG